MWDLLFVCDGFVAAVADPDFKLKAHEWDGRALGAALAAHGLPTFPAVVLGGTGKQAATPLAAVLAHSHTHCSRARTPGQSVPELSMVAESYNPSTRRLMPSNRVFKVRLGLICVLGRMA